MVHFNWVGPRHYRDGGLTGFPSLVVLGDEIVPVEQVLGEFFNVVRLREATRDPGDDDLFLITPPRHLLGDLYECD
jgi:hypothetical protein